MYNILSAITKPTGYKMLDAGRNGITPNDTASIIDLKRFIQSIN